MAHARHPLRRREMSAFQPLSAQTARTRISMSLPNCRRLVSECICCSAAPPFLSVSVLLSRTNAPSASAPPTALLSDECRLEIEASLRFVLVRLVTGDRGMSCASGCGMKLVMASITSTRCGRALLEEGVMVGDVWVDDPERSCSRFQLDLARSSERWIEVYV